MILGKRHLNIFVVALTLVASNALANAAGQDAQDENSAEFSKVETEIKWLDDELQPTDDKSEAAYLLADVKKVDDGYRLVIKHLDGSRYYETGSDSLEFDKAIAIGPYKTYFQSGGVHMDGYRDNNGVQQGTTIVYAKNGKKKREMTYEDGELNGPYKTYMANGKLLTEQMMKDDEINGLKRGYFKNGQVMYEAEYKNGEKHGKEKRWDPEGNLTKVSYFKEGKREGVSTDYFEDGSVKKTQEYKGRKRVGETKLYYESGDLRRYEERNDEGQVIAHRAYDNNGVLTSSREQIETDKGLVDERKWFNKQGKLTRLTRQALDKKWRMSESYDEDGQVRDRREFKGYDLHGLYVSRYGNGLERVQFVEGKRHGSYTVTNSEGEVKSRGEYDHGKKVGEWVIDDNYGVLKEQYNANGKLNGVRESYDNKGNLRLREHYKNGVLDGEYREYSDGELVVKGEFIDGKREGEWSESLGYAPFKTYQGNYKNDVRVGEWRTYSPEGYLRRIESFSDEGALEGVMVSFSEEGALYSISQYKNDRRHGKTWSYTSGQPFSISVYEHGELKEEYFEDEFELSDFP